MAKEVPDGTKKPDSNERRNPGKNRREGKDRRVHRDPNYSGPTRRLQLDRRHSIQDRRNDGKPQE